MRSGFSSRWFSIVPTWVMASVVGAQVTVLPTAETEPARSVGDSADDAAIWVHPTEPALSTVIGTDKLAGLSVFDLSGQELQFLPEGRVNNVDLRYGFPLGGLRVALVAASVRLTNRLALYAVDPNTRLLRDVSARTITVGLGASGLCLYQSASTGETYAFVTAKSGGGVEQWRLFDDGTGRVDAVVVRSFLVGSETEGCVADDQAGHLFLAEEDVGIWRYGAEPNDLTPRVAVDVVGVGGHLTADVEGLALFQAGAGAGYLIASSQGDSSYVVYERAAPHGFRFSFKIGNNAALGVDAATATDGIDVTNLGLGGEFGQGLFVAQDNTNTGANQNFKLVPWSSIASAAVPPLAVAPSYDPGGALSRPAAWQVRNGTGVNPLAFLPRGRPVLGAPWESDLACVGHAPGLGFLIGYARPKSGPVVPLGELLVDLTSSHLFTLLAPHAGDTVRFHLPIPNDLALCGFVLSVQGLCQGAPALQLTNAVDLRLGD